jgi:uncharacterized protein
MEPITSPNEVPLPVAVSGPQKLAPVWHTAVLIIVILASSALGAVSGHPTAKNAGHIAQYIVTMVWEWVLFGFVVWGVRKSGTRVRDLVGGRWEHFEDFLLDVAIAIGFWILSALVLVSCAYLVGLANPERIKEAQKQIEFLLPSTGLESAIAVMLAFTAGFCEEVIFRGYLQRQLGALAGNIWTGLVLSGIFFGCAHGYEGWRRMVVIAVYGMLFGVLAHFRKSLRPGMMTHGIHDSAAMILPRFLKGLKAVMWV